MAATQSVKKPINLLRGWPAPSLLPAPALKTAAAKALSDPSIFIPGLQYAPDPGYQPLREELARWLGDFYSVTPDPDRICITGGASQNLACVLQSFTDPVYTRNIWMIAPCYFLACPIFADSGFEGRLKAVPEDDEGIDLEYLERGLRSADEGHREDRRYKTAKARKLYRHVIYVVPTCANPSGKTMSLRRREALVHLARKHNALVVCDDVYDFLQWPVSKDDTPLPPDYPPEMRLPRLCDIDLALGPTDDDPHHFGHAISNGSFSKIVGPGVRTGWVEASPAFAYGLSQTGSTRSGGAPSQFAAVLMRELLETGTLDAHLRTVTRPALQRRHRLMMRAIGEHIQPFGIEVRESSLRGADIYGGYFVWFSLPPGVSSREVADRALETENLIIGHGAQFEVLGDEAAADFGNDVRLCFAWEPEEDVVEGVVRLGMVLQAVADGTEYQASGLSDVNNAK